MDVFWRPCGTIFGPFWGDVEIKNQLGGSIDAPLVSDLDLDSSTHPILEDFGKLLRTVLDIFLYFFWIQVLK